MILDARGRAELAQTTSREKRVRHWRRFRAIELLADGNRPETVAEVLGCSRASVYVWAKAWREQGIEGLREAPHSGKQPSLEDRATRLLVQLLEKRVIRRRGATMPQVGRYRC